MSELAAAFGPSAEANSTGSGRGDLVSAQRRPPRCGFDVATQLPEAEPMSPPNLAGPHSPSETGTDQEAHSGRPVDGAR